MKQLLMGCNPEKIFFERDDPIIVQGHSFGDEHTFVCWINSELDEYEQVFTLAHERLHCHEKYYGKSNTLLGHNKNIEQQIDGDVLEIFKQSPEVFNYLTEQLRLAKVREINDSVNGKSKEIEHKAKIIAKGLINREKYPWLLNYAHQRLNIYDELEELKLLRVQSLKEPL